MRWRRIGPTGWGEAWSLELDERRYFVKVADAARTAMLACEADGLLALRAATTLRVPAVVAFGSAAGADYLILEWLDLAGAPDGAALGRALAALHRAEPPRGPHGERFGWRRDNWIGGTRQENHWCDDWCAFFRDRRLAPQFGDAHRHGYRGSLERDGERLLAAVPALLHGHSPSPSHVHGDLWSGNAAALAGGEPVVFDPAFYVGDREVDLAMSELFGGFGDAFAAAYRDAWPLDSGYPRRRDLYNLYHLLNHLNLFGAGYLTRTQRTLAALVAMIR